MKKIKIAVVGLGYIGLPLSVKLSKFFPTIGYDLSTERINELNKGLDRTEEVSKKEIKFSKGLKFSSDLSDIKNCNFYIVAVPSPIKKNKKPDFGPLKKLVLISQKLLKKRYLCF